MVRDNNLIVDKTAWIAEALTGPRFKLITRPARFGKTTNLSMLEAFLTKDQKLESMDLFAGFAIGNDTKFEKIRTEHQHKYAVLHFSFLHCSPAATVLEVRNQFTSTMRHLLDRNFREYSRYFQPDEKQYIHNIVYGHGDLSQVLAGYDRLIRTLRANGYKIAILVDEYDAPFQNAIEKQMLATDEGKNSVYGEMYTEAENLMRQFYLYFFRDGLKIPPDCGIIIGMIYTAKNRIFSDLTNFKSYTTLGDDKFGPYFGFSEHEVKWLIGSSETNLTYKEFEEWYDGYHFGQNVVFNPFAVVSALENGKFDLYWAESGSGYMILQLIKSTGKFGMLDLHFLLIGKSLPKEIQEDLLFTDLLKTEGSYWALLTDYGFVEATKLDKESSANRTYTLRIPNKELRVYLMTNFKSELEETKREYDKFIYAFDNLHNETSYFAKFLEARFNTRAPYYKIP